MAAVTAHALSENLVAVAPRDRRQGLRRRRLASVKSGADPAGGPAHHRGDGRAQERATIRRPRRCRAAICRNSSSAANSTASPRVLVVNQPTWGVDAGAARRIRQALIDLARSGSAVLVISQDLDETVRDCRLRSPSCTTASCRSRMPIARGDAREDRPADGRRRAGSRRACAGDRVMRIELVKRPQQSTLFAVAFALHRAGADAGCRRASCSRCSARTRSRRSTIYFIEPLREVWSLHELAIKAAPLILIARRPVGLLPLQQLEHRRRGPVHHRRHRRLDASRCCFPTSSRRSCCR